MPQVIQRKGSAVYHHIGHSDITKHYYANGQRLAGRVMTHISESVSVMEMTPRYRPGGGGSAGGVMTNPEHRSMAQGRPHPASRQRFAVEQRLYPKQTGHQPERTDAGQPQEKQTQGDLPAGDNGAGNA